MFVVQNNNFTHMNLFPDLFIKLLQVFQCLVENLQGWSVLGLYSHVDLPFHGVRDCVAAKLHIRTAMKQQWQTAFLVHLSICVLGWDATQDNTVLPNYSLLIWFSYFSLCLNIKILVQELLEDWYKKTLTKILGNNHFKTQSSNQYPKITTTVIASLYETFNTNLIAFV